MSSLHGFDVFLSYSRKDAAQAEDVRKRLIEEGFRVWQDVTQFHGGDVIYSTIQKSIDGQVRYLAVLVTRHALASDWVRREMRLAREAGVCVVPLLGEEGLTFEELPRFLKKRHLLDVQREVDWETLKHQLTTPCPGQRAPMMADPMPMGFVERTHEFERLKRELLAEGETSPVAISTALVGAGGLGKTWLARALCHDEAIQDRFDEGILWVALGEQLSSSELLAKVDGLARALRPGLSPAPTLEQARHQLREAVEQRDVLVVIDDVWKLDDLNGFPLTDGGGARWLLTTRDRQTLPEGARTVRVDTMRPEEGTALLGQGLPQEPVAAHHGDLEKLARQCGHWPLLLSLVNGVLRDYVRHGATVAQAIQDARQAWKDAGTIAFDQEGGRQRALGISLERSLNRLDEVERERFLDLAIFPEDVEIPWAELARLWRSRHAWSEARMRQELIRLADLSLLQGLDLGKGAVRLHDLIRAHLRTMGGDDLKARQGRFLLSFACETWADLPTTEGYLWQHLAWHLEDGGQGAAWLEALRDVRFLLAKAVALKNGPVVVADLLAVLRQHPEDARLKLLLRRFRPLAHRLGTCATGEEAQICFAGYVMGVPERDQLLAGWPDPCGPRLFPRHSLPDTPHPDLLLVLQGHGKSVQSCAFSPNGELALSASEDATLRLWSTETGENLRVLNGHTGSVNVCAFSPDGTLALSASADHTLRLWAVNSGADVGVLQHSAPVNKGRFSPDGRWILSASGKELRLWEVATRSLRHVMSGHEEEIGDCTFSPDGRWVLSAALDGGIRLWSTTTGAVLDEIRLPDGLMSCAISPDGQWALAGSKRGTLHFYTLHDQKPYSKDVGVLKAHKSRVQWCAFHPRENRIWSASWNELCCFEYPSGQRLKRMVNLHPNGVFGCALSCDGTKVLTSSKDATLRLWNAQVEGEERSIPAHATGIEFCVFSQDGTALISTSSNAQEALVWSVATGHRLGILDENDDGYVHGAVSSGSGDILLARWDGLILIRQDQKQSLGEMVKSHPGSMPKGVKWPDVLPIDMAFMCCALNAEGNKALTTTRDGNLHLHDTRNGQIIQTLRGHTSKITACVFNPVDSSMMLSASMDGTLRLWRAGEDESLFVWNGHERGVLCCAFAPDGRTILSGSEDNTLRLWSSETGQEMKILRGHGDAVTGCAMHPHGPWALSASKDQILRLWDIQTGQCLQIFPVLHPLLGCAFAPNGKDAVAWGVGGIYFMRFQTP